MKLLVTHHSPDIDAITSVWIFKRFDPERFADAKVSFVDAGSSIDLAAARQKFGSALDEVMPVDTGWGPFDHHQPECGGQHICASSLVYDEVCVRHPELRNDWALEKVMEYALDDDHFFDYFWPDPTSPKYLFTFGSILHGVEFAGLHTDETQLEFGMRCLDGIYASLVERKRAMDVLEEKGLPFETRWGKGVAVPTSNQAVLRYAQLSGYKIVIQRDPKMGNVRIKAAPLPEIDLTPLYEKVMELEKTQDKPGTWYFHNGKHMLLNGSSKVNNKQRPTQVPLEKFVEMATQA